MEEEEEDEGGRQDIWNKLEGSKTHGEIREKRPTVQWKRKSRRKKTKCSVKCVCRGAKTNGFRNP